MADIKTKQNDASVIAFLNLIEDERRRNDCLAVLELMKLVTGEEPKMWGANIIGFGNYHYKYASGREGEMCRIGFSPRKNDITLYLGGSVMANESLLAQLGKYKSGKGCLYINKIADIDNAVLKTLIEQAYARTRSYEV